ncbi:MAG: 30S ribosomal protein S17 [Deltaproteobacteria bacterium]
MSEERGRRKTFVGSVVSDKMDKTVVVAVESLTKHPFYGKYVKRRVKFFADDAGKQCGMGDRVLIEETRPISRLKRWRVKEIVEKAG